MKLDEKKLDKIKANQLKKAMAKDKPCKDCADKQEPEESPIKAMIQRLGNLVPELGNCGHPPQAMVIKIVKTDEVPGQKKVLEKSPEVVESKHNSPFIARCVAAVTGGKPKDRADESSAFAKCVSTQQKSHKDLDKAAEARPGMTVRTKQFEKSLNKVRKHPKNA